MECFRHALATKCTSYFLSEVSFDLRLWQKCTSKFPSEECFRHALVTSRFPSEEGFRHALAATCTNNSACTCLCIGSDAASLGRDTNPGHHIWAPTKEPCTHLGKAVSDFPRALEKHSRRQCARLVTRGCPTMPNNGEIRAWQRTEKF